MACVLCHETILGSSETPLSGTAPVSSSLTRTMNFLPHLFVIDRGGPRVKYFWRYLNKVRAVILFPSSVSDGGCWTIPCRLQALLSGIFSESLIFKLSRGACVCFMLLSFQSNAFIQSIDRSVNKCILSTHHVLSTALGLGL